MSKRNAAPPRGRRARGLNIYHLTFIIYLVKPVDFDNFTSLMEDLGCYWLGWNHYPWSEGTA
jgi:hypothetical protein